MLLSIQGVQKGCRKHGYRKWGGGVDFWKKPWKNFLGPSQALMQPAPQLSGQYCTSMGNVWQAPETESKSRKANLTQALRSQRGVTSGRRCKICSH